MQAQEVEAVTVKIGGKGVENDLQRIQGAVGDGKGTGTLGNLRSGKE